jgi:nucleoside 2-deoxyribosyltransferase
MTDSTCPVCCKPPANLTGTSTTTVECSTCGTFHIVASARAAIDALTLGGTRRFLLSAATRDFSDRGNPITLDTYNIPQIIAGVRPPADVLEGIDRLLLWVSRTVATPGEYARLDPARDYSIVAGRDSNELSFYLEKAKELRYIERPSGGSIRLDINGWERLSQIRTRAVQTNRAFVAMSFHTSLEDAWAKGIEPALTDAGYDPIRVDRLEHNDKIDDLILAEIRRSGLVVADFTAHRAGVYFEAGFAMGIGIPVIRTCREDDIANTHFDTRQYNHVLWTSPEELRKRLLARIQATAPRLM